MNRAVCLLAAAAAIYSSQARAADPAAVMIGKGVQIYACTQSAETYAWRLKAPEATLTNAAGRVTGKHFAGPSWQAGDGSIVVGEPLIASPAPTPGAIPWIVLRAKDHESEGLFAKVAYIVRTATEGGIAPTTGCDAAHSGTETRIDYSATYTFFPG